MLLPPLPVPVGSPPCNMITVVHARLLLQCSHEGHQLSHEVHQLSHEGHQLSHEGHQLSHEVHQSGPEVCRLSQVVCMIQAAKVTLKVSRDASGW